LGGAAAAEINGFGADWGPIGAKTGQYGMAEYIASLLDGLRQVASSGRMPFLAYLIDVALEEANNEKTTCD
jgi:hypothetical protein